MSGTTEGAKAAAKSNKAKYGPDFYARIGRVGGARSRGGGFTGNPALARQYGKKGGLKSRRKPQTDDTGVVKARKSTEAERVKLANELLVKLKMKQITMGEYSEQLQLVDNSKIKYCPEHDKHHFVEAWPHNEA